ncbi:MAG: alpha-E domain-containing protein [Candidatus Hydrogenedens sp.]|nr:alpha-E domain-containing protein [Candidatus Hydrogenedens sp.]
MLSRVAESIFWMCRYIERAENIARVVNVNWHLALDDNSSEPQWLPLISITADEALFAEKYDSATQANVIEFLAFDRDYPNSIYCCLKAARENARTVREIIPTDLWEQVNTFYQQVDAISKAPDRLVSPRLFFELVIKESNEFIGRTLTTMTHDDGWFFCRAGRMLERADKTSRILDVKYFYLLPTADDVGSQVDNIQWSALLRSASALQAYRQTYGQILPVNVCHLLLLSNAFPRSVRYCVESLQFAIARIAGSYTGEYTYDCERYCNQLHSQLACAKADEVVLAGVHEFVDSLQIKLNRIGGAISDGFFSGKPLERRTHRTSMQGQEG